ncbi:MAG: hypothetical protein QM784_10110 [Polyangiaceae bacterium]
MSNGFARQIAVVLALAHQQTLPFRSGRCALFAIALAATACSGSDSNSASSDNGTFSGGTTSADGGNTPIAGAKSTSTANAGGTSSTGSAQSPSTTVETGGNPASGGTAGAAANTSAGGRGATGSSVVNGGSVANGGASTAGGRTATGGTAATGGVVSTGGLASTGGTTSGGTTSGGTTSGPPNFYATSSNLVEIYVNGNFLGKTTTAGALLSTAANLVSGTENVIAIRATKGSANTPYLHAEMDGTFGKAGTTTAWKAKSAASTDELTGTAWAAKTYDDTNWSAATNVNVNPKASVMTSGPAKGIWTNSASNATAIFRMRFYVPANWNASKPYGFGAAVTGGDGGAIVTVSTPSALAAAVTGNTAKIIQVTGTIDFTGTEGTKSNTCCDVVTCSNGQSQIITDDLGACNGKTTFGCTYDAAGTSPLKVGSNKTIIGIGPNATIKGKGFALTGGVSNIIIRNLTITNLNPRVVWGGDAITLSGASKVWIDHNRISLIGRQFIVSGFEPATNVTFSYNEFDGNTPYSSNCDGTHYWTMLFAGSQNTMTVMNNWIHHTSGRGPHAGGTSPVNQYVYAQFVNDYYQNVTGHAADPATNANLFYEGTFFQSVKTPFVTTDGGISYAPVASNVSSTASACSSALGRSCVANANSTTTTFPLNAQALTAMGTYKSAMVAPYPAAEVPYSVPHLAGPGHI